MKYELPKYQAELLLKNGSTVVVELELPYCYVTEHPSFIEDKDLLERCKHEEYNIAMNVQHSRTMKATDGFWYDMTYVIGVRVYKTVDNFTVEIRRDGHRRNPVYLSEVTEWSP